MKKIDYKQRFLDYISTYYNNKYTIINVPDEILHTKSKLTLLCNEHDCEFKAAWATFKIGKIGCLPCSIEKKKQTCIKSLGVDNPAKADSVKAKMAATNLERRNVVNPGSCPEVKKKRDETCLKKYGNKVVSKTDYAKEKTKETCNKKYGCDHFPQSQQWKEKVRQTSLTEYGCDHFTQSQHWKDSVSMASMEKNGVPCHTQSHINPEHLKILMDKELLEAQFETRSIKELSNLFNVDRSTISTYAKSHGIHMPKSSFEKSVGAFLDTLSMEYLTNIRTIIPPTELDFYIPTYNLAIETCGLRWHSVDQIEYIDRNYHKRKMDQSNQHGIRLITIFEDEWNDVARSRIKNMLGISERGVGARKLNIVPIDHTIANIFVDKYHIQGKTSTIIVSLGAYHNDELVAVMQFGLSRNNYIELKRYCTDGKTYPGLASRLLSHYKKQHPNQKIVSFADLRWSEGDVYEKLGFKKESVINPDYFWCKREYKYHKQNFTKSNIKKKFNLTQEEIDSKTERTLMLERGYYRVYDCGKIKYVLE